MKIKWNGLILTLAAALVLAWSAQPASGAWMTSCPVMDPEST